MWAEKGKRATDFIVEHGKTWCSAERKHVITEQQWNQSILHRHPLTQEYQNLFARLFTVPLFIPKNEWIDNKKLVPFQPVLR